MALRMLVSLATASVVLLTTMNFVVAETTYIHTDYLGSVAAESNASGWMPTRYYYEPFGREMTQTAEDEPGYTGHLFDTDLDLSYMQQRYYDPSIGRFYSNDPVSFVTTNPIMFNRYAYANDNPYSYTDPDGRYGRGRGWTNNTWRKFQARQNAAAKRMSKRAKKLDKKAAKMEKAGKDGSRLKNQAAALRTGVKALENQGDGKEWGVAHAMTSAEYAALPGTTQNGAAGVIDNSSVVNVNMGNAVWSTNTMEAKRKARDAISHESLHSAGFNDPSINGVTPYIYGNPIQKQLYQNMKGTPEAVGSPEHILHD